MNTKFEANVASELPKTKMSKEPGLPWKLTNEDLEETVPLEDERKSALVGTPPFKTRAIFLVLLIAALFVAALYYISASLVESENARAGIQTKEMLVSSLRTDLERREDEKDMISQNLLRLEKEVKELSAEKELYTAVIETLTKKDIDIVTGKYRDKPTRKVEGLKDI